MLIGRISENFFIAFGVSEVVRSGSALVAKLGMVAAAEHHQMDPHVVRQRPAPSCSRRVMPTRAPMRSRLFSDEKGRLKPIAS